MIFTKFKWMQGIGAFFRYKPHGAYIRWQLKMCCSHMKENRYYSEKIKSNLCLYLIYSNAETYQMKEIAPNLCTYF